MPAGTNLDFLLKQRDQAHPDKKPAATEQSVDSKPTIMIVDDELGMRQALKTIFSSVYNVIIAADGREAVELFNQHKNISCVVTDALMPNMDGFQTAKSLHQINPDIPIIMLTAHQAMHEPAKVVDFNFKGYVTKGDIHIDAEGRLKLPSIDDLERRVKSACKEYALLLRKKAFFDSLQEERAWLEEKIQDRTKELAEANAKLSEALKAKEETQNKLIQAEQRAVAYYLVQGVRHEMNTHLQTLRLNLQNIKFGDLVYISEIIEKGALLVESMSQDHFKEVKQYAEELKALFVNTSQESGEKDLVTRVNSILELCIKSANILENIINQLKEASDREEYEKKPERLDEIIDDTIKYLHPEISKRLPELQISKDYGTTIPQLICNRYKIMQALTAQVMNSLDAMEIKAYRGEKARLYFRITKDGDKVTVTTGDNGVGISKENQKEIFKPFFTAKGRGQKGTGIGLSQVASIIGKHDGEYHVKSEEGQFTEIIWIIPVY